MRLSTFSALRRDLEHYPPPPPSLQYLQLGCHAASPSTCSCLVDSDLDKKKKNKVFWLMYFLWEFVCFVFKHHLLFCCFGGLKFEKITSQKRHFFSKYVSHICSILESIMCYNDCRLLFKK
jgi:hypothetical protein